MSTKHTQYLEITSTYRDRKQFPLASDFEIPISQTGRNTADGADDPVSNAAKKLAWHGATFQANIGAAGTDQLVLIVEAITAADGSIGGTGTPTVIIVTTIGGSGAGTLHTFKNYYRGAVIHRTADTSDRRRIIEYVYLGNDKGKFVMESAFTGSTVATTSLTVTDPTDLDSPSFRDPQIFVPMGSGGTNYYIGCILYNQTRCESRPIKNYDDITRIVTLVTTGPLTPTNTAGNISSWARNDVYSIRGARPIRDCTSLNGDIANNPATKTSFNLPFAASSADIPLVGSFIEVLMSRETGVLALTGGGSNVVTLNTPGPPPGSSTLDDYYVGAWLRMTSGAAVGQIETIISYDGGLGVARLKQGFSPAAGIGDTYELSLPQESRRIVKYVHFEGTAVGGSINTVNFATTGTERVHPVTKNGFYNNLYIVMTASGDIRLIESYVVTRDPITNVVQSAIVTVFNNFAGATLAGDAFTITSGVVESPPFTYSIANQDFLLLQFNYDNLNPFIYTGSLVSNQEIVNYEIELLNLILPNQILDTGYGSHISFYQYVYVRLKNVTGSGIGRPQTIFSNNANSNMMTFRATIDDIANPVNSSFIKVDGDGMVQTLSFKPTDNLRFEVRLSNGEFFKTIVDETFSPQAPNPLVQISAMFSIRRLDPHD
jgi:hypothetical protein